MNNEPPSTSTILVIFGVTGDLSHRYLLPALYQISKVHQLPSVCKIIGITRQKISFDDLIASGPADSPAREALQALRPNFELVTMDLTSLQDFTKLKEHLNGRISEIGQQSQIIFHFAVPPKSSQQIISLLGEVGLNGDNVKLLLEKPFGTDLHSAQESIAQTAKFFKESQLYRIDHYLAKEMAQNIAVFLGSNALFHNVWDNRFIESLEIVVAESIGIEGRVGFYESTGALRDVVQSHLLQLAALTLMEPSNDVFNLEELAHKRLQALQFIEPLVAEQVPARVVRAQYEGYREEVKNSNSIVETFAALTLNSRDPRWAGVPIRLITGKNLNERLSEIRVYFKKASASEANLLKLRIQPKEGMELDLWVKEPGYEHRLQKLPLSFAYDQHFARLPEAYEQVLVDAIRGTKNLFASSDEVLATWQILQPVLEYWTHHVDDLRPYMPGSSIDEILKATQPNPPVAKSML